MRSTTKRYPLLIKIIRQLFVDALIDNHATSRHWLAQNIGTDKLKSMETALHRAVNLKDLSGEGVTGRDGYLSFTKKQYSKDEKTKCYFYFLTETFRFSMSFTDIYKISQELLNVDSNIDNFQLLNQQHPEIFDKLKPHYDDKSIAELKALLSEDEINQLQITFRAKSSNIFIEDQTKCSVQIPQEASVSIQSEKRVNALENIFDSIVYRFKPNQATQKNTPAPFTSQTTNVVSSQSDQYHSMNDYHNPSNHPQFTLGSISPANNYQATSSLSGQINTSSCQQNADDEMNRILIGDTSDLESYADEIINTLQVFNPPTSSNVQDTVADFSPPAIETQQLSSSVISEVENPGSLLSQPLTSNSSKENVEDLMGNLFQQSALNYEPHAETAINNPNLPDSSASTHKQNTVADLSPQAVETQQLSSSVINTIENLSSLSGQSLTSSSPRENIDDLMNNLFTQSTWNEPHPENTSGIPNLLNPSASTPKQNTVADLSSLAVETQHLSSSCNAENPSSLSVQPLTWSSPRENIDDLMDDLFTQSAFNEPYPENTINIPNLLNPSTSTQTQNPVAIFSPTTSITQQASSSPADNVENTSSALEQLSTTSLQNKIVDDSTNFNFVQEACDQKSSAEKVVNTPDFPNPSTSTHIQNSVAESLKLNAQAHLQQFPIRTDEINQIPATPVDHSAKVFDSSPSTITHRYKYFQTVAEKGYAPGAVVLAIIDATADSNLNAACNQIIDKLLDFNNHYLQMGSNIYINNYFENNIKWNACNSKVTIEEIVKKVQAFFRASNQKINDTQRYNLYQTIALEMSESLQNAPLFYSAPNLLGKNSALIAKRKLKTKDRVANKLRKTHALQTISEAKVDDLSNKDNTTNPIQRPRANTKFLIDNLFSENELTAEVVAASTAPPFQSKVIDETKIQANAIGYHLLDNPFHDVDISFAETKCNQSPLQEATLDDAKKHIEINSKEDAFPENSSFDDESSDEELPKNPGSPEKPHTQSYRLKPPPLTSSSLSSVNVIQKFAIPLTNKPQPVKLVLPPQPNNSLRTTVNWSPVNPLLQLIASSNEKTIRINPARNNLQKVPNIIPPMLPLAPHVPHSSAQFTARKPQTSSQRDCMLAASFPNEEFKTSGYPIEACISAFIHSMMDDPHPFADSVTAKNVIEKYLQVGNYESLVKYFNNFYWESEDTKLTCRMLCKEIKNSLKNCNDKTQEKRSEIFDHVLAKISNVKIQQFVPLYRGVEELSLGQKRRKLTFDLKKDKRGSSANSSRKSSLVKSNSQSIVTAASDEAIREEMIDTPKLNNSYKYISENNQYGYTLETVILAFIDAAAHSPKDLSVIEILKKITNSAGNYLKMGSPSAVKKYLTDNLIWNKNKMTMTAGSLINFTRARLELDDDDSTYATNFSIEKRLEIYKDFVEQVTISNKIAALYYVDGIRAKQTLQAHKVRQRNQEEEIKPKKVKKRRVDKITDDIGSPVLSLEKIVEISNEENSQRNQQKNRQASPVSNMECPSLLFTQSNRKSTAVTDATVRLKRT